MFRLPFLIVIVLFSKILLSQNISDSITVLETTKSLRKENLVIFKDKRIDTLNTTFASSFELKGYRVQIFSGNKRQPANKAKSDFIKIYDNITAHLNYEQPYYKVRVGDFRTKLEALKYKNKIVQDFPNCFIVKDKIETILVQ